MNGDLVWMVIDLTIGKMDGFYNSQEAAKASMKGWAEEFPRHEFVVAKITDLNQKGMNIHDHLWLGMMEPAQ